VRDHAAMPLDAYRRKRDPKHTPEPFERGSVGAAVRPGQPDSGGAQFFVCVSPQPAFSGQVTQFGRVSEGMDVIDRIARVGTGTRKGYEDAPLEDVVIVSARRVPPA